MNKGEFVYDIPLDTSQQKYINLLALLRNKPTLYIANVNEDEIIKEKRSPDVKKLFDFAKERGNRAIRFCGKLEAEISNLQADKKSFLLEEYNLHEPGLDKLIHASNKLLCLKIFFSKKQRSTCRDN